VPGAQIGMVARWKPVHSGHAAVLRALVDRPGRALLGIGSSNQYDARNPFTLEETEEMIRLVLEGRDNYDILPVPDLGHGPRWRAMVAEMFAGVDLFVTDNPYVASLLAADFPIARPVDLVPEGERVRVDGTMVRRAMAQGDLWQRLVPEAVAGYIESRGLDLRFRREFGLETLALEAP